MTKEEMVEEFLCSGCVAGHNTKCGHYKPPAGPHGGCDSHVLGTRIMSIGNIALGMPKGFNRPGYCPSDKTSHNQMTIRLWPEGTFDPDNWNWFNVPVWKLEQDGFLFVRTAMPRIAFWITEVIEGGKADALAPQAVDVTPRFDEYD